MVCTTEGRGGNEDKQYETAFLQHAGISDRRTRRFGGGIVGGRRLLVRPRVEGGYGSVSRARLPPIEPDQRSGKPIGRLRWPVDQFGRGSPVSLGRVVESRMRQEVRPARGCGRPVCLAGGKPTNGRRLGSPEHAGRAGQVSFPVARTAMPGLRLLRPRLESRPWLNVNGRSGSTFISRGKDLRGSPMLRRSFYCM